MCSDALALLRVVPAGTKMQVHPAALPLNLIDLALTEVLTASLDQPAELFGHYDLGQPRYQWAVPCPAATSG
jgi:hypothetical protein